MGKSDGKKGKKRKRRGKNTHSQNAPWKCNYYYIVSYICTLFCSIANLEVRGIDHVGSLVASLLASWRWMCGGYVFIGLSLCTADMQHTIHTLVFDVS